MPASDRALHLRQKELWEREHRNPQWLPFLDAPEPNKGVVAFWEWLLARSETGTRALAGLDVGCGKGRNSLYLAEQGNTMQGFDFVPYAVDVAQARAAERGVAVNLRVADVLAPWPWPAATFDFVLDSYTSADIERAEGRRHLLDESLRVLRPGGYHFLQIDTPEEGLFAELPPGPEPGTVVFPNGKIEALLTREDVAAWSHPLRPVEVRYLREENEAIAGQRRPYIYLWMVLQAPRSGDAPVAGTPAR